MMIGRWLNGNRCELILSWRYMLVVNKEVSYWVICEILLDKSYRCYRFNNVVDLESDMIIVE